MDNINSINENYNRLYVRKKAYIDTYYNYKKYVDINNKKDYNLYNNEFSKVNTNFRNLCNVIKEISNENNDYLWNTYNTYSSDTSKLVCDNIFKQNEKKEFLVDIKKIAKKQINMSNKLESDKSSLKDFKISIKYKDIETTFDIKASNKTNFEIFDELDAKINKSNLAVYSRLTNTNNKVSISIMSNKTGKNENFNITGSKEFIDITNLSKIHQKPDNSLLTITDKRKMNTITEESTGNIINIDNYNITGTIKDAGKVTVENKINKKSIIGNVKQFVESYNLHLMHCKEKNSESDTFSNNEHSNTSNVSINCLSTIGIYKDSYGFLHIDEVELSNKIDNNSDYVKSVICGKSSFISTLDAQLNSNTLTNGINNNLNNNINDSIINNINDSIINNINDSIINNINNPNNHYDNNLSTAKSYYSFYKSKLIGIYNQFGQYGMINSSIIGILVNIIA